MINTILSGVMKMSFHVLDFFLEPIERLLYNAGLGNSINWFADKWSTLMGYLRQVIPWVIEATGLPKQLFGLVFATFLGCVGLRISVFVLKMIVKWWDRIVA